MLGPFHCHSAGGRRAASAGCVGAGIPVGVRPEDSGKAGPTAAPAPVGARRGHVLGPTREGENCKWAPPLPRGRDAPQGGVCSN